MTLTNKHYWYVHFTFQIYAALFLLLLFIYSVSSLLGKNYSLPSLFVFVSLFISSYYLFALYRQIGKNIDYKKIVMENRTKIIAAAVLSLTVIILRSSTLLFYKIPGNFIISLPRVIFETILFPMVNFYPGKTMLLAMFNPLKLIVEFFYFYTVIGFIVYLAKPFKKLYKSKRSH